MEQNEASIDGSDEGALALDAWGDGLVAVHCNHCREDHLVRSGSIPDRCPLCHHLTVETLPTPRAEASPEQVAPFVVGKDQAARLLGDWCSQVRLRPEGLSAEGLAGRLCRYWIPMWLVDADVVGDWRADAGFQYEVVSDQDRYGERDGWRSHQVKEKRIRWEPRIGKISRHYDNVVAPGAEDDVRELMGRLGGYDLGSRMPYSPQDLNGAVIRVPTLSRDAAWPLAEPAFKRAAEADCRRAAGADQMREFAIRARYEQRNWSHLLLPAYTTWYEESGYVWPVLVNGQNGRIYGQLRASAAKARRASLIMGGIALALFALGGLLALLGLAVPPMVAVGSFALVVGLALALAAPIPAISVWVRNRSTIPEVPP